MKKLFNYLIVFTISFIAFCNINAVNAIKYDNEEVSELNFYYPITDADNGKEVYFGGNNVIKYNLETNTYEVLYTSRYNNGDFFKKNNILYLNEFIGDKTHFVGIDVNTKEIVYEHTYEGLYQAIGNSIIFDEDQNLYIQDDNGAVNVYDKNGNFIDKSHDINTFYFLEGISPNHKILFVNIQGYHEGMFVLDDNRHFSDKRLITYYQHRTPNWTFLKDGIHAANQYGELAKFNYNDSNNNVGVSYRLKASIGYGKNIGTACEDDKYIWIPSNNSKIVAVDKDTYKTVKKVTINKDNITFVKIMISNNYLYALYHDENEKYYLSSFNLDEAVESKKITLTNHTTLTHTKNEVINKYKNTLPTFNYSNSIYTREPILTAPYDEGEINNAVRQDGLNQLNYFRWLAGLNPLTINEDKMARSQKGALIQAVNNELSHFPSRPEGMSDEFYNDAKAGTGAAYKEGDTYSGNVSYGDSVTSMFEGFVSDSYNLFPDVGHRLSMLDPFAKQVSFGYVSPYSAISIYYDDVNNNPDTYYPWPSAGYFPVESMPTPKDTLWSIWLGDNYKPSKDTKITLTYNKKNYVISKYTYQDGAICYNLPSELLNTLIGPSNYIIPNKEVSVLINDLSDNDINTVDIKYTTKFIATGTKIATDIETLISIGDDVYITLYNNSNFTFNNINETHKLIFSAIPSRSVMDDFEVAISNPNILTYDKDAKTLTSHAPGTTTITFTEPMSKVSKTYKIKVLAPSTDMSLSKENMFLVSGSSEVLKANLLPLNTTDTSRYTYTSDNVNVATVSSNGKVTAINNGTATITVKSSLGYTKTCTVTVSDYKKGDMDNNGSIELKDIIILLRVYTDSTKLTDTYLTIGDMDNNGSIELKDIILLLREYTK